MSGALSLPASLRGPWRPKPVAWEDGLGLQVFADLDPHDWAEAERMRGRPVSSAGLWADWRAAAGIRIVDVVFLASHRRGRAPFAVFALAHTGIAGAAEAALLTRVVGDWRREIAMMAAGLREAVPGFRARHGVRRIEARSWAGHPSGSRLLEACGLRHEVRLAGFGSTGGLQMDQHAIVAPFIPPTTERSSHVRK